MPTDSSQTAARRTFLKTAAGGVLILKPETVFGSQANSAVEVGMAGCGGRGNWIGPFFPEFAGARIVALADVIKDNLESTRVKFNVEESRAYYGPNAAKDLANSKVDAVVIETPTYYHAEQAEAAVAAGKHVYMAKPMAVDVPGCRSVLASAKQAQEKNLSYLVDFQTRAMPAYQEAAARVHRGDIGKVAFAQVIYYAGRPSRDKSAPGMDAGLARMVNFYMDRVLGGDIIVEQNIHVIDVANWLIAGHPLKAHGTGGRTDWADTVYNAGDAWDHFAVTYWYPNDVHASFSSNQLTNSYSDLCVRCFGVHGCADTHYAGLVRITGRNTWLGTEKEDTFRLGAINNVKTFIQSIRDGKPVNNAEVSVESNLTAILGRMAAYQQRVVTWEEMMGSNEKWEANLKLQW
jgi:predicted dehydrogenase